MFAFRRHFWVIVLFVQSVCQRPLSTISASPEGEIGKVTTSGVTTSGYDNGETEGTTANIMPDNSTNSGENTTQFSPHHMNCCHNQSGAGILKNWTRFTGKAIDNNQTHSIHSNDMSQYTIPSLVAADYCVYMLSVVLMVLAIFMNCLVLSALSSKGGDTMKSSFLIRAIAVANIPVSFGVSSNVLPHILLAFGGDPARIIPCYEGISLPIKSFFIITQLYTGIIVAVDRLVSIAQPLKYHVHRYTMLQKIAILGGLWGGMLVVYVSLTAMDLVLLPGLPVRHICAKFMETHSRGIFMAYIMPNFLIFGLVVTLVLYSILFALIMRQKKLRRSMTKENHDTGQSNLSLALTYYLVHLGYFVSYIPRLIQYSFFSDDQSEVYTGTYAIPLVIYQCNTIIDPAIFTWRIPAIRNYIWGLFKGDGDGKLNKKPK